MSFSFSSISAVILSAGYSSRMHSFKPLLSIGGIPVIGRLIHEFYQGGIREIIIVVGHRQEEIISYIKTLPEAIQASVTVKVNPVFERGMYTSVQAGAEEVSPRQDAFFILPVDYPLIQESTLSSLIHFWYEKKQSNTQIVYPIYQGRRGHPPLLSTRLIPQIVGNDQKQGLRSFLSEHQQEAENAPVDEEAVLWDMDKEEDFIRLSEYYTKRNSSS